MLRTSSPYDQAFDGFAPQSVHGNPSAGTFFTIAATSFCQQLDYLEFIDIYHERIKMFQISKDAEFRPSAASMEFSRGFLAPGAFRSLGDGQVDFAAIFSKLAQDDFPGWAVLEPECCLKRSEQGAG